MKKIITLTMLLMFGLCAYVEARVQYDSTGRTIIQDDTIRGRRRAAQNQGKIQAMQAAKFDYNSANRYMKNNLKNNYYQKKTY